MSVAASQQRTFLRLVRALRPHWRHDPALPSRVQTLLARHREFGARDRRLYRELIYTTLRYLPWIEPLLDPEPERAARVAAWLAAGTRDTAAYRAATCGDWPPPGPTLAERAAFLGADPGVLLPPWFQEECPAAFATAELEAQLARAPVWLRLQTDDARAVAREFESHGWRWRPAEVLPSAWRLLDDADVTRSDAYARGAIEIQDLGSQLLLETIGIESGRRWLDACAGAGGKTLQLARMLGANGGIDAHDVRPTALDELAVRIERVRQPAAMAAIRILRTAPPAQDPAGAADVPAPAEYDGVLVDAPCSGSGTWRRSPHLKWTTTPEIVTERAARQRSLLARYAAHVRPGGRLVYATCSLARQENEAVIAAFLATHPGFERAPFARTFGFAPNEHGLTIMPARLDTDGFFVASLRRR